MYIGISALHLLVNSFICEKVFFFIFNHLEGGGLLPKRAYLCAESGENEKKNEKNINLRLKLYCIFQ